MLFPRKAPQSPRVLPAGLVEPAEFLKRRADAVQGAHVIAPELESFEDGKRRAIFLHGLFLSPEIEEREPLNNVRSRDPILEAKRLESVAGAPGEQKTFPPATDERPALGLHMLRERQADLVSSAARKAAICQLEMRLRAFELLRPIARLAGEQMRLPENDRPGKNSVGARFTSARARIQAKPREHGFGKEQPADRRLCDPATRLLESVQEREPVGEIIQGERGKKRVQPARGGRVQNGRGHLHSPIGRIQRESGERLSSIDSRRAAGEARADAEGIPCRKLEGFGWERPVLRRLLQLGVERSDLSHHIAAF